LKATLFILISLFVSEIAHAQLTLRGKIMDSDTSTAMPFVYVINKSSGNGTMSDNDGRFTIFTSDSDTLICTFVGYSKLIMPVRQLKRNEKGEVVLVMNKLLIQLGVVNITTFKIKPYERDYMRKIIDESKMPTLNYLGSPITALYMTWSREGKQIRKLAKIFEDLLIEEQVQKKLSPEILRKLTGDEKVDYAAFRKFCVECNDDYIVSHDGVELYSRVMGCYKRYRSEGRR